MITYQQARNLIVCRPDGIQIEHVKAVDEVAGTLETWQTYDHAEGHQSVWVEGGKTVERPYMLLGMVQPDGSYTYMSRVWRIDFDVVDKRTGEVLYEIRQPSVASFEAVSEADRRA